MKKKKRRKLTDWEIDHRRSRTAHKKVGTLSMDLIDWVQDIHRFRASGMKVKKKALLLESLEECQQVVDLLIEALR